MSTATTTIAQRMAELIDDQQWVPPTVGPQYHKNLVLVEDAFWGIADRNEWVDAGTLSAGRHFLFRLSSWVIVHTSWQINHGVITQQIIVDSIRAVCEWFEGTRYALCNDIKWGPQGLHDTVFEHAVALREDVDRFYTTLTGNPVVSGGRIDHNPFGPTDSGLSAWLRVLSGDEVVANNQMRPSGCAVATPMC